jgi:hypothetical protein
MEAQSKPNWRAIAVFYFLACLWSWPFFWWRDVNTASWNAWRLPEEIKGLTQQWGPALAAIAVFYLFPRVRSRFVSLLGSSWKRSALCFLTPIFFACIASAIQSRHFSYKLIYYLLVGGFSTLGEEVGWRGVPPIRTAARVRHTQKPTISRVRAGYQKQNLEAAGVILQRIAKCGGEDGALVQWARSVLTPKDAECGRLFEYEA